MSVIIKEISKHFGAQKAVDNISFEVGSAEVVGFLGPNGAGKSTTMRMLTCFLPPTSGTALVCGYDIIEDPIEVRKNIGYLPENNPLYTDLYVKEYLLFISDIYKLKKKRSKVDEVIQITGLTREKNKRIGQLSKGYRQRVGIAQAMIHDPEVLILDEPTSGLDPNQLVEIRELIKSLGKEKTLILSSHILQEVQAVCDRVIIINNGEIVADDPIEVLSQRRIGNKTLHIKFKENVESTSLGSISGIDTIEKLSDKEFLVFSNTEDINERVFRFSVEKGYTLLKMSEESESLEDVFKNLTT